MRMLLSLSEQNVRNRLHDTILKSAVLQCEASTIEEIRDFLAHVQEILDITQHCHTDLLHLDYALFCEGHGSSDIRLSG